MKKTFLMLGLMLLPTVALAAPNFSGTWQRNNANSDPDPYPLYWITRPGPSMGGGRNAINLMTVHQKGNTLQVADPQHPLRNYTLDGQPHTRPTDNMLSKASVTANMQGDNVVIDTTQPYGQMPGNITLKEKEVWALSPDGKTLTVTITRDIPAKQATLKEVYERTKDEGDALCSAGCVTVK
jgi:hypothetical protein